MPARRPKPSAAVLRLTDASGSSARGWAQAVAAAVKDSDVAAPVGVEVQRLWAEWDGRRLSRYHASVRVAYRQELRARARRTRG